MIEMQPKSHMWSALSVLTVFALAGCGGVAEKPVSASAEDPAAVLRESGYTEQAEMLADGEVTVAEIEKAGALMQQCFVDAGHELTLEGWNPVDGVTYLYLAEPAGGEATDDFHAAYDDCTRRYLQTLADHYRATVDAVIVPELMAEVRQCLESEGFTYTGEPVNQYDLVDSTLVEGGEAPSRKQVDDCVISEATAMYPDIVTISISW
ncbi:hypothetical protein [Stackebrandtia albiflava]|nr:hypothetical protein [Stackebrandtia albiflava]